VKNKESLMHIPGLSNAFRSANVGEIKNLLDQATTHVTFWGTRMVTVGDSECTLDRLARKVDVFRSDEFEATQSNAVNWNHVVKRTCDFYTATDKQVENSHFITRVIDWIFGETTPWCFDIPTFNTRYRVETSC
jgi:hypothetical protein